MHGQTLAVYRLLDELRRRHPAVEIESCASGGARVDLGILARTDRVWASDTNDALERQTIQRWTQLLLPPELVGSHVGPARAHTTGRTHDLSFRGATALFGHFGIEWDVTGLDDDERAAAGRPGGDLPAAPRPAALRRRRARRPPGPGGGRARRGGHRRLRGAVRLRRSWRPGGRRCPDRPACPAWTAPSSYRVEVVDTGGPPFTMQNAAPGWWPADGAAAPVLPGSFLGLVGLQMPVLGPEQAVVAAPHPGLTGPGRERGCRLACPVRLRLPHGRLLQTGVPPRTPGDAWHAVNGTLLNVLLVAFFLLLGGFFSGSEIALVSLREGQVKSHRPARPPRPEGRRAARRPEPVPGRRPDRRHARRLPVRGLRRLGVRRRPRPGAARLGLSDGPDASPAPRTRRTGWPSSSSPSSSPTCRW